MALIIFTDKINSGKSEMINKMAEDNNFNGFVQLKKNNKRYIKYLETNFIEELTCCNHTNKKTISIGNYIFNEEIFCNLNNLISRSSESKNRLFVIDEWGLLEKQGMGLFKGINYLIKEKLFIKNNYLIIIRDWLFDDFFQSNHLHNADLIKCNMLNIKDILNNC